MICKCGTQFCYMCGKQGDGHMCQCYLQGAGMPLFQGGNQEGLQGLQGRPNPFGNNQNLLIQNNRPLPQVHPFYMGGGMFNNWILYNTGQRQPLGLGLNFNQPNQNLNLLNQQNQNLNLLNQQNQNLNNMKKQQDQNLNLLKQASQNLNLVNQNQVRNQSEILNIEEPVEYFKPSSGEEDDVSDDYGDNLSEISQEVPIPKGGVRSRSRSREKEKDRYKNEKKRSRSKSK